MAVGLAGGRWLSHSVSRRDVSGGQRGASRCLCECELWGDAVARGVEGADERSSTRGGVRFGGVAGGAPRTWLVALVLICVTATACQRDEGERRPGPCRAVWTVRQVVDFAGARWTLPLQQGNKRVMSFGYDAQGRLVTLDDDDDNDGVPESRITIVYGVDGRVAQESIDQGMDGSVEYTRRFEYDENGEAVVTVFEDVGGELASRVEVGGSPMRHIWEQCAGDCAYDPHGNILHDRDRRSQDSLDYDYDCWR